MKKFAQYILILIALAGIFGSRANIYAQATQPTINYQLLAPLPCTEGTPGCVDGKLVSFDPTSGDSSTALGSYLNMMITLFIGICAVLAVVMIVLGGLEYMTSELPGNKEHGKERITGAVFGLVLALGAYALLYTINPDLLNTDFDIPGATVDVMIEGETAQDAITNDTGIAPTGPTALCQSGIQKTSSGMFACGSIAQNLDRMILTARSAKINISGGGYRSIQTQTALRVKNCGGNTTDRNAKCNPPTALPGFSNHNSGLAFDLKCDGTTIQASDNGCFIWLKNNAATFGLANLPSEPWHWSVDGR